MGDTTLARSADPAIIKLTDVWHRFPHAAVDALAGITLSVPEGSCFALLGPNGAGKSTLVSLLTGMLRPQRGEIVVAGHAAGQLAKIRAISAVAPQDLSFYPSLTGRENLQFFLDLTAGDRRTRKGRLAQAVETCQLAAVLDQRAATYSGGVKRRLNLAIALLNAPRILYLDEPTVGVDARSRQCITEAIRALNQSGVTVIYTSHYMEEVEAICDEIAIIDGGRVVLRDSIARLLSTWSQQFLEVTLDAPASQAARAAIHNAQWHDAQRLTAPLSDSDQLPAILSRLQTDGRRAVRVQYGVKTLESVYLEMLQQGPAT